MKTRFLILVLATSVTLGGSMTYAQPTSDLLEKAIYTEETVGDLEAAIKIYEEVIAEGKATRQHAAQAQYRMALCLLKMGKKDEATAAFQKLVADFADQKELVAEAKRQLPEAGGLALDPVPWVDGEQLQLTAKLATGLEIGAFTLSARTDELDGRAIWRTQVGRYISLNAPNQGVSRVVIDRETFQPISSLFRHSILGTIEVDYSKTKAEVFSRSPSGAENEKTLNLDGVHYENEQGMFLFRRLPLEEGYKVDVPIFAPIGAGPIKIGLEVVGKEKVTVPAGEFECYKCELPIVQQTFWYSADEHRYLVKFEAGGISVQLNSIRKNQPGESVTYVDDQLGFSIATPTEWYLLKQNQPNPSKDRVTYLLADPDAMAMSVLIVQSIDELDDEDRESPRAWAEQDIRDAKEAMTAYTVRPDSWEQLDLNGTRAISFVADFKQGTRSMVEFCIYGQGESNAIVFCSKMSNDWFDKLKAPMNSILATYEGK